MNFREIEYEFNKKMTEINELKKRVTEEGQKKERFEREIKLLEGRIRQMEGQLQHANRSEKVLEHEEHTAAIKAEHYNQRIRELLRELDGIRSRLR